MSKADGNHWPDVTPEQIAVRNARTKRRATQLLLNSEHTDNAVPSPQDLAPVDDWMPSSSEKGWPVFEAMLRAAKLPAPLYEFRFDAVRKWRFDMAFPQHRVAIEVDGGVWSRGPSGHNTGSGITRDMEKSNAAQIASWVVLRYTPDNLVKAIDDLKKIFASREST